MGDRTQPAGWKINRCGIRSGIIYELHVRAYCDSDGDGTGDFAG